MMRLFLLLLMNVSYAILFPISKWALEYASPMFLVGFKMTISGVFVLVYQYFFRYKKFLLPRTSWLPLLYAGFLSIYVANVLDFWGFKYLTATKSCILYNLSPFIAAFVSRFYFKEYFSWKKWLGLAIALIGIIPIILVEGAVQPEIFAISLPTHIPLAELAVIIGIIASPLGWLLAQGYVCTVDYDAIMANGVTMVIGGICALMQSYLVEGWNPIPVHNWLYFLATAFAIMFFANIIGNTLYIELLKYYSVTFLALTSFSEAIVVALLDWGISGVPVALSFWFAMAVIFIGLYIFYQEEYHGHQQLPTR